MKNERCLPLLCFLLIFLIPTRVIASSDYVLPYPSSMPGSKFYPAQQLWGKVEQFWYFGDFGQIEYSQKQADKYLVEARTLFEYKQYLLGFEALQRSSEYFQQLPSLLQKAQESRKNVSEKRLIVKSAAEKHREELEKILQEVPESFVWTPEKQPVQNLALHDELKHAIAVRETVLQ